jgi:excisionase family DNA binding protein
MSHALDGMTKHTDPRPRYLFVEEWARVHGLPESQARRWALDGALPAIRMPGRVVLVPEDALERLLPEWARGGNGRRDGEA